MRALRIRSARILTDVLNDVKPVHRSSLVWRLCSSVMKPASRCVHVACMCMDAHVTGGDGYCLGFDTPLAPRVTEGLLGPVRAWCAC
jgi:hypothetical protein